MTGYHVGGRGDLRQDYSSSLIDQHIRVVIFLLSGTIRMILPGKMGMASDQAMPYLVRINGQFVLISDAPVKEHTGKIVKPTASGAPTRIIWIIEKGVLSDRSAENVEAHFLLGREAL